MKRTNDIVWNQLSLLLLMVAAVMVVACSDSDSDMDSDASKSCLQLDMLTRANVSLGTPSGYHTATLEVGAVQALLMTAANNTENPDCLLEHGQFEYTSQGWISTLYAKSVGNPTYYLYGFMPASADENYTYAKLPGDNTTYADGILLTLHTSPVCLKDVCVITGVQHCLDPDAKVTGNTDSEIPDLVQGKFGFVMETNKDHYLRIMAEHIYAGVLFTLKVDATYGALRTIKVKKLELMAEKPGGYSKEVTIPVTANTEGANPIGTIGVRAADSEEAQAESIYLWDDEENPKVLTTDARQVGVEGYFATGAIADLTLKTTYDVYDKEGNLVRKDCTANNKLTGVLSGMTRGQLKTVNLKVSPTYLYALSEPDLDNPTLNMEGL